MYLNFDQYRATFLKDFLPGFYTLQNNDKCSMLLQTKGGLSATFGLYF
jgi:hypothetical protein